jgi:Ca2+-binding EF-hand superfamily protein
MDPDKKKELRKQILNEKVFGPMVDKSFNDADLDKSGFVEKNELAILLKSIHTSLNIPPPSNADIEQELKRLDKNSDGKISKEEFRVLVKDLALFSIDNMTN